MLFLCSTNLTSKLSGLSLVDTLPETNEYAPEIDAWKMKLSFGAKGLLSEVFAVSFRECSTLKIVDLFFTTQNMSFRLSLLLCRSERRFFVKRNRGMVPRS